MNQPHTSGSARERFAVRRSGPVEISTRSLLVTGLLFAAAGCVDPSTSIAAELTRYGLDAAQSRCVGERLEANLSAGQLQQLARAAGALKQGDSSLGRLTAGDLARVATQIRDPQVALEVGSAVTGCGIVSSVL